MKGLLLVLFIFFIGFQSLADLRSQFVGTSNYFTSQTNADLLLGRKLIREGRFSEAYEKWISVAQTYEKEGRFQEAAWTYFQAGEQEKSREILKTLHNFLENAVAVQTDQLDRSEGITKSSVVTFANGTKAIFKEVDAEYEVAAYRLDQYLELNMVPFTLFRFNNGKRGSLQVWISPTVRGEKIREAMTSSDLYFWDRLIQNSDRHVKNTLIREGHFIVLIDHGRIFGKNGSFNDHLQGRSLPIPRLAVYEKLKALDDKKIDELFGDIIPQRTLRQFKNHVEIQISRIELLINKYGKATVFSGDDTFLNEDAALQQQLKNFIAIKDKNNIIRLLLNHPGLGKDLLMQNPDFLKQSDFLERAFPLLGEEGQNLFFKNIDQDEDRFNTLAQSQSSSLQWAVLRILALSRDAANKLGLLMAYLEKAGPYISSQTWEQLITARPAFLFYPGVHERLSQIFNDSRSSFFIRETVKEPTVINPISPEQWTIDRLIDSKKKLPIQKFSTWSPSILEAHTENGAFKIAFKNPEEAQLFLKLASQVSSLKIQFPSGYQDINAAETWMAFETLSLIGKNGIKISTKNLFTSPYRRRLSDFFKSDEELKDRALLQTIKKLEDNTMEALQRGYKNKEGLQKPLESRKIR